MTAEQFNEKYKDYLEEGHYGLDIHVESFIVWLDEKFQEFIKKPGFSYSQIKAKFGYGRFYCEGLTRAEESEVEQRISKLFSKN
jgi:hypothetical protein